MWLLIAILKREEDAEKMVSAMLELELTDAAIIDSESVENLAARAFPLFAEVGRLFGESLRYNRTLFCRLPERSLAGDLLELCRAGGFDPADAGAGVFMLIPCENWATGNESTA